MQLLKATTEDMPQIKALWTQMFDDGTPGFPDFVFSSCKPENFYIAKDGETVVSMLISMADMEYKGSKGFYLYSACTVPEYRGKGVMRDLVAFALEDKRKQGVTFCVLKPAEDSLFDFWAGLGFTNVTKIRHCSLDIKKNIWTNAQFDIVTASRFKAMRDKFCEEPFIHYTAKGYEAFAYSHYISGGSTAETEDAYAVYYAEGDTLRVVELLALSTNHAVKLLQAIRERTGCEKAEVYLSPQSNLFLGEGKMENDCAVYGIKEEIYTGLIIE